MLDRDAVDGYIATRVLAEDRQLPIVGIAIKKRPADGRYAFDALALAQTLVGLAHVVVIRDQANARLDKALPGLGVPPGGARIWWPGLVEDDEPRLHKAWDASQLEHVDFTPQVERVVVPAARDGWRESDELRAFQAAERAERSRRQNESRRAAIENIAALKKQLAAVQVSASSGTGIDDSVLVELQDRLNEAAAERERVAGDLDAAEQLLEEAESLADQRQAELEAMKAENFRLNARVESLAHARVVAAKDGDATSLDELFAEDVRLLHQQTFTAQDIDKALAIYRVREGFLESVAKAGADPDKVKEAVMHVACGVARSMEGRKVHRLRTGEGPNDPPRTRESDGAVAWRCNVQTNSAAARRLHYWITPSNEIEFVSVVTHDDFAIAE